MGTKSQQVQKQLAAQRPAVQRVGIGGDLGAEHSQADCLLGALFQPVKASACPDQTAFCSLQIFRGLTAEQLIPSALRLLQGLQPSMAGIAVCLFRYLCEHGGKTAVFPFTQFVSGFDLRVEVALQHFFQRDPLERGLLERRLKLGGLKLKRRGKGAAKDAPGGVALLLGSVGQPDNARRAAKAAVFFQQLCHNATVSGPGSEIGRAGPGLFAHRLSSKVRCLPFQW